MLVSISDNKIITLRESFTLSILSAAATLVNGHSLCSKLITNQTSKTCSFSDVANKYWIKTQSKVNWQSANITINQIFKRNDK